MVSTAFIGLILAIALLAIAIETLSIRAWFRQCDPTARAIGVLKRSGDTLSLPDLDPPLVQWLRHHLDGRATDDTFTPRLDAGNFVLLAYPRVLSQPIPRSSAAFAPTLLTALGVLGTFTGIYLGLQGVGLETDPDTRTLLATSAELLGGMKVAFSTSLVGLGAASGFILILALGERVRLRHRDRLRRQLGQIAILDTPARMLSRLDTRANRDAAQALQSVATRFDPDAFGTAVGAALNPQLHAIRDRLDALHQQQATAIARWDETAAAVGELRHALAEVTQGTNESLEAIRGFQQDTLARLQDFTTNLQQILGQFRSETGDTLHRVSEQMQQAIAESIEGMSAQRTAFESSAQTAAIAFQDMGETLEFALNRQGERQAEMLRGVESQARQILTDANQAFLAQSNSLSAVGSEASQLMERAGERLHLSLENIDELLQSSRDTVQDELERFRLDYQHGLEQFFSEQNNLLVHTLGWQRQGLDAVVTQLNQTFDRESSRRTQLLQDLDRALDNIRTTMETVSHHARAIESSSDASQEQLRTLIEAIGQEAKHIDRAYQNLAQQFERSLQLAQEQLSQYLKQAHQTYTDSLQQSDTAAAQVCERLNDTSRGLMEVANYLVASAKDLNYRNGRDA